jgi:nicotinate-nucleotide adenylyltransferase
MIRAVFGGSFDPPHDGHVAMVRRILADGLAAFVHVVPAAAAPLKGAAVAVAAERLAMTRLAFAGLDAVRVEDLELARPGPSYTIDTVRQLAGAHPGDEWRLVIGADQLGQLAAWAGYRELLDLAPALVLARRGADTGAPAGVDPARIRVVRDFDAPVSSSDIRAILAAGRLPRTGLDPAVAAHIRLRGLYGPAAG